jgi:hypothetical protein
VLVAIELQLQLDGTLLLLFLDLRRQLNVGYHKRLSEVQLLWPMTGYLWKPGLLLPEGLQAESKLAERFGLGNACAVK